MVMVWAICWTALLTLLPRRAGRIVFGISYYILTIYALVETGYYLLFGEMLWLSDFRYASEGSDYLGANLHNCFLVHVGFFNYSEVLCRS